MIDDERDFSTEVAEEREEMREMGGEMRDHQDKHYP